MTLRSGRSYAGTRSSSAGSHAYGRRSGSAGQASHGRRFCPAETTLADLGADLLYCWDVPAADSPLIEFDGSNVVQLEHSGSAASAPLVSGTPSLVAHHTTGSNGPWLSVAPGNPYTTLDAVPSVASGSRIAIYTVCIPGADNLGTGMPGTIPDGFGYPHAVYDGIWGFDGYDDQDAGTTYLSASDETAIGPDEAGLSYQARAVHASDSTPRIYCTAYLHSGCVGTVGATPVAPSYTYTGGSGPIESYYVGCQAFYFSAIVAFADAETFAHHDAIVRTHINSNRGIYGG